MTTDLLYDYLQVRGGAERVSLALAAGLPAVLRVHAVDRVAFPERMSDAVVRLDQRALSRHTLLRAARAWRAFRRMGYQSAPAALFSGHFAPLAWRAYRDARRVLYLHGPPLPFCFDPEDPALAALPRPLRKVLQPGFARLKRQYLEAARGMHHVFANSAYTAAAFRHATGRDATVLMPPVDARFFAPPRPCEGYWISLARHEPMKRLDRIIDAFAGLPDTRLVVAGGGSQRAALERRASAAPNIRFLGVLEPEQLAHWLRGARASVHISRAEPFGLAIAESLAAGIPVLTSDEGAAPELVRDARHGERLPADPDVATLRAAIQRFSVPRDDSGRPGPVSSAAGALRLAPFAATLRAALHPGA